MRILFIGLTMIALLIGGGVYVLNASLGTGLPSADEKQSLMAETAQQNEAAFHKQTL
jgi:hypothetical protein